MQVDLSYLAASVFNCVARCMPAGKSRLLETFHSTAYGYRSAKIQPVVAGKSDPICSLAARGFVCVARCMPVGKSCLPKPFNLTEYDYRLAEILPGAAGKSGPTCWPNVTIWRIPGEVLFSIYRRVV